MPIIKDTIAAARWAKAKNKVDKAVSVFTQHGVAFSLADAKEKNDPAAGIIGIPKSMSKRDTRKIQAAANIMFNYSAGFFKSGNRKEKFDNKTVMTVGHYAPLRFADHEHTQDQAYQQAGRSMHLRASQKFLQRICFNPRLQVHPNRRILNMTAEEAQEWSANVESLWRSEKEAKSWDEAEKNDYSQLSDMAFYDYLQKGEFFAVHRAYYEDDERITNMSIQLFSPFQIQSPIFTGYHYVRLDSSYCPDSTGIINAADFLSRLEDGSYIEGGIEYDKRGREVAIFICPVYFSDPWTRIPIKNRAGFTQVLHGFIQQEPGQKRGIPESAYAWHEFMNIKDMSLFEMQSARLNATISGTVTADSNAQPNGKVPMAELGHERPTWSETVPTQGELAPYGPPDYDVRDVEGGGFIVQNFTPGYKYTEHDTKRPNVNIANFIERMLDFIYPAMYGVATGVVNQRLEGSYNASKAKIDLSWKQGVEYYLKQFSSDWHRPNYIAWLAGKVASGDVPAPGFEIPKMKNAWCAMSIPIPAKPSLNPLQEAKAGEVRITNGFSNRELEAQQQTGTSFEENAARLALEKEMMPEMPSAEGAEMMEDPEEGEEDDDV